LFVLTSTLLVKKSDAATEALGRSRGGFSTKVYAAVDALGNPLRILLRPGQKADISEAEALIEGYRFGALIADKGFDSNDFIGQVESLEAVVVIPPRKNRHVQREINRNLYADRNKIERFFGRIKHYRRIATRYEKTARNYSAFLYLASIMTWLL
jgi:transposase